MMQFAYTYDSIYWGVGVKNMKYSEAQKEATARYSKKAYDLDEVVPKEKHQVIKDFAASQGKSLNRFIRDAINY